MTAAERWRLYRHHGYTAAVASPPASAEESFYLALLAWSEQHAEQAVMYAQQAASAAPEHLVYTQAAAYLEQRILSGTSRVYTSAAGFTAFIRGGGNLPLYQATSEALRQIYRRRPAPRVLDIGTGDGHALLPALDAGAPRLDVLEPSPALYTTLTEQLHNRGVAYRGYNMTLQDFVARTSEQWDVVQATYSLQSIAPDERRPLLAWLREHTQRCVIVEFDVPEFHAHCAPARVEYIVARYQQGLAEYRDQLELVGQGFLMPVFFGYFDRTVERTNYEQPAARWVDDLRQAGFAAVRTTLLYPYWWAPAYIVDASQAA